MRRIVIAATLVGAGILIVRARPPKVREHLTAQCENMFERMPDTFPPKKIARGIEEIRVKTGKIPELLETPTDVADKPQAPDTSTEEVHHAA